MLNIKGRYFALAGTLAAAGGLAFAVAPAASASTHACDTALNGCRSIQSEVPNRPDLDVQGGAANVGNAVIVFPRSSTAVPMMAVIKRNVMMNSARRTPLLETQAAGNGIPSCACITASGKNSARHAAAATVAPAN